MVKELLRHVSFLVPGTQIHRQYQQIIVQNLSKKAIDFSGAEIFQAIVEGMYLAFNENREFTTNDVMKGISEIIPLAQLEQKKIQTLQKWAQSGRIRTASSNF